MLSFLPFVTIQLHMEKTQRPRVCSMLRQATQTKALVLWQDRRRPDGQGVGCGDAVHRH